MNHYRFFDQWLRLFIFIILVVGYSGPTLAKMIYPRFVYVPNSAEGNIAIYTVNAVTGKLRYDSAATGTTPVFVAVHPSGKFVYTANWTSNNISIYTIDQATGALTLVGNPVSAGIWPMSVTIAPSGKFAYVANAASNNISIYAIDQTAGVLTEVGTPVDAGHAPYLVTIDPTGKFAYTANVRSSNISIYAIDQFTGTLTVVGAPVPASKHPYLVTINPSGKFAYVANQGSNNILVYNINRTTGALTAIGNPVATDKIPSSVTIDPIGKFAYVVNTSSDNISIYSIDQNTGALTAVGIPVATGKMPTSCMIDASGKFAYVANVASNNISIYNINQATGSLTPVGTVFARTGTGPNSIAIASGTSAIISTSSNDNDNTKSLQQKPPLEIPFAVHKAGQVVQMEVIISYDRVYPFSMSFEFKKNDEADRAHVKDLVGDYQKYNSGKLIKPGIEIPIRLEIHSIQSDEEKILVDQTIMVGRNYAYSADSFDSHLGVIRLLPGRYKIKFESLKDHPELASTPVKIAMSAMTRGDVYLWSDKKPSARISKVVDQIRKKDLLNHLSELEQFPDNSRMHIIFKYYPKIPATYTYRSTDPTNPKIESTGIPMPVAVWDGCAYHIYIDNEDGDLAKFGISKSCGNDERKVYIGKMGMLFHEDSDKTTDANTK